ncbi:hypothetical protein O181_100973 [Austropuccinia psidii MF-1]|uniref:Uncharacterized protein n=1 Tax=Austropuccinia psidii MF-1 TaxID=1389203 RepID=A0A9Q3PGN3_9BASI|nr:hypothetical protein [Austropuccinia psidii MF-1]
MASYGHLDPSQIYDGYKEVAFLDPSCAEFSKKGEKCFQTYKPWPSKCHNCFVGNKPCQRPGASIYNVKKYLWSKKEGAFGIKLLLLMLLMVTGCRKRDVARWTKVRGPIPVGGRPIYSSSEVPIYRINSQGVVKRLRRISNSPTDPNAERSDELDGEGVEVVSSSIGHQSSILPLQTSSRRFQSQVIPSTPRNVQPILSTIPYSIPPP